MNKDLVAIGYLDNFDLDFIFLNDTEHIIVDERYLLEEGGKTMNNWIKVAQISVTIISQAIIIMKEIQDEVR